MSYKKEFIEFIVRSGVLIFGDFTTKMGRQSPYFINTGNYKTGAQLHLLGEYYAKHIEENGLGDVDALFGPAYKGIPLAVSAAAALYRLFGRDVNVSFNRKEAKDHGEGGVIVGYRPGDGDRVLVVEDVISAGASIRETVPVLKACGDVEIAGMVISADRMERGAGELTATEEVYEQFGIRAYPIVTVREIIDLLYGVPIDGKVYMDDQKREAMEDYLRKYGTVR